MKFTLSTDTVCDIFRSELKERGIEYISTYYTIEGVEHKDEFTREEQFKEFYAKIRSGEMPTTSQVTKNDYDEFFDGLINKYDGDILHVTISSGLTTSPLAARQVAEEIFERTGRHIYSGRGEKIREHRQSYPYLVHAVRLNALKARRQGFGSRGIHRHGAQHKTHIVH